MFLDKEVIEVASVRDQVADMVRRMILSGELEPGQQLVERTIGEQLSISTTPIKEAFRILYAEGLIFTIPRKGSFVSELAKSNLQQSVFVRSALDGVAAFFAAKYRSSEELEQMEQCLADAQHYIVENDADGQANANMRFHTAVRGASRNQYLVNLISNINTMDKTIRELSLIQDTQERSRAQNEHLAILAAVKAGDSALAENLMISHVRRVVMFVVDETQLS